MAIAVTVERFPVGWRMVWRCGKGRILIVGAARPTRAAAEQDAAEFIERRTPKPRSDGRYATKRHG